MPTEFTKPIFLGNGWSGEDWGLYAATGSVYNAFGDMLLYRGTRSECERLYERWAADPSAFDDFIFERRRMWWQA